MGILRRIAVGLACGLLPLMLFIFGLSFSLHRVFGAPDSVKHALAESGIYDSAALNVIAEAQKQSSQVDELQNLPVDQPDIQGIFQKSLPASSIQPQVEKGIDNVYSWIHGDTPQLNLSLELGQNKNDLLGRLSQYVKERATSLPVCPSGTPIPSGFDAFTATCRPALVTPEMAAAQAEQKLKESDFFQESSVDANSLKDDEGRTLSDRLDHLPSLYDRIVKGIIISGVLSLAFILIAIFLSQPWRDGLRRVAKITLVGGIITTVLAMGSVFVTGKLASFLAESAGSTASFQSSLADAIHTLASDVRAWWLGYGILLIILAVAAFISLKILSEKEGIDRNNAKPPEDRPTVVVN